VGLVVKRDREQGTLDLLESTAEGVTVYPLISRLRAYATEFTYYMALRKLQVGRQRNKCAHTDLYVVPPRGWGACLSHLSRHVLCVLCVDRRSGRKRWRLGCCSL
jgi:hypothetical protein